VTRGARLYLVLMMLLIATTLSAQTIHGLRTTSDLSHTLEAMPDASFARQSAGNTIIIEVDESKRFQTMDGFGASLTDGSAWLLHDVLPAATKEAVMEHLFDPTRGIGLSFLRQPIASSDLSRNHYSFDDMPMGETDPQLRHFSTKHDDAYVFPVVREALKLNPAITVMATPWSPPAWMKTKHSMNGGALREDAMAPYAAYLVRSIESFQQHGIPVKYLSVQNEPLNETRDYPGTLMQASQAKRLIGSYLGPDLKEAGLSTTILAYDHNWDHPEYPIEVLSDPVASPFVAGSALHCYGGDVKAQDTIHERFPNKGIWLTECAGGSWQKENPLLSTAHLLVGATRHWAKSVVLWTIILDTEHNPPAGGCGTCRGLVTVDLHKSSASVIYNGDFYGLGQASRFVTPGAVRIGSTSPGPESLETVAFQNVNGTIALFVINQQAKPIQFAIRWHDRLASVVLTPQSVATYTWMPTP
jgi:glucosylceramidase